MLVLAVLFAYCGHKALMLQHWPPRDPILQLRGLHVATVAFKLDVLLQERFFCCFFIRKPKSQILIFCGWIFCWPVAAR